VLPIAVALRDNYRVQARVFDQLPIEVLDCAKTLRQLRTPGDRVIARKWHIAYHGDVEALGFPFADSLSTLAKYAHENHARWLYFSWPEAETRPQFYYLLDTTAVVPGLTPRRVTHPRPAVLYEIGPDFGKSPWWFANDTLVAWHRVWSQLQVDAMNPTLLYNFAGMAWLRGKLPEARDALEQAAQITPNDVKIYLLLGNVLIMQGDAEKARAAYQRADGVSPGNVQARLGIGWAQLMSGNPQAAAEVWRPLISSTHSPKTLARMYELYSSLGDNQAAAAAEAMLRSVGGLK